MGYHALLYSFNLNRESILYDPNNITFLSPALKPINYLSLTKISSLDSTPSLNIGFNFSLFP